MNQLSIPIHRPRYQTVMADPPWPYRGVAVVGNGGRGEAGGRASEFVQVGAAGQYPLMSIADICGLRVTEVTSKQAHLYLWVTNSFLVEGHEVCRAWGFEPKTLITWAKLRKGQCDVPSMKCGYYFRSATEHILFGVRGSLRLAGPCKPTLLFAERLPHSVKPETAYQLAEVCSPAPRLEVFARRRRPGWDAWGNEVQSDLDLTPRAA